MSSLALALFLALAPGPGPWPYAADAELLVSRIDPPRGYSRAKAPTGSYPAFLRRLPLKPAGAPVLSHSGEPLRAPALAVVDIDVGERDLQQCADSVIRLHAEYLLASGHEDAIAYKFTSGDTWDWRRRKRGHRPVVKGNQVRFPKQAKPRADRAAFRAYLDEVFMFAGTASLARDAQRVALEDARAGDFFVIGGSPGHAVQILDVATSRSGERAVLLGQGFMPAQSFHVIRGPLDGWFPLVDGIETPSWPTPFTADTLRRLPLPDQSSTTTKAASP